MSKGRIERRDFLKTASAAALASAWPLRTYAQSGEPLNLGFQNTSWGTVAMVADAQKSFVEAGANVKFHRFGSGKETRDAMISGRVDVGVLGGTPFIVGAAKGDMDAIGVAMYAGKTNAIVAAKDSGIKSIPDLKGKRVASQLGSATNYVFLNKVLPKFGMTKDDVHIVNVTFQNQVAAIVGKSADAFAGVEPFPSVAEVEGLGKVIVDYSQFDMQPVFLAVNAPVLEKRKKELVAFMRGWLAAVHIVNQEPERAVAIVWNQFKAQGYDTKEAVFKLMLTKLDVKPQYVPNLHQYLDEQTEVLVKEKQINGAPDWSRILDTSVLAQATKS
jgi:ABC-type nitrate/sulfonate/bicarbonate transport system substrate-binding protein